MSKPYFHKSPLTIDPSIFTFVQSKNGETLLMTETSDLEFQAQRRSPRKVVVMIDGKYQVFNRTEEDAEGLTYVSQNAKYVMFTRHD